jgi:hypothetical protein
MNMQNNVMGILMLIVGISVATIVLIFAGSLGGQTYATVESDINAVGVTDVSGESFTASNETWVSLNQNSLITGTITVYNASGNDNTSDFTVNTTDGTLKVTGDDTLNGTSCTIDYTHGDKTIQNHVKNGIVNGFKALSQTGGYMPLIVLAVVIFMVLSMILGLGFFTGFGYPKQGGGAL